MKRAAVLSVARSQSRLSRVELAEATGLSQATLTSLVRDLIAEGYLVENGVEPSRTGRPRTILEFVPRVELVAAVSLAPDEVSCQIADSYGDVVAAEHRPLKGDVENLITEIVQDLTADHPEHLRGVAVAVPGVTHKGRVRLAPHVGVVRKRAIGTHVSKRLGVPVVVDNDVNLMAVGERSMGAAASARDVMLFHFTDGVGAGLILDGRIRRGASGGAGEVGFFPTDGSRGEKGIGSFEARWSTLAVAERLRESGHLSKNGNKPVATLMQVARKDDDLATYRDDLISAWGRLIVSCICVVDPGLVLLGGAATELDDDAFEALSSIVRADAPSPTTVVRAELGTEAVLHGAVSTALSAAGLLAPTGA